MRILRGALIDDEDYERLAKFPWKIQKNGKTSYAFFYRKGRSGKALRVYMHWLVMQPIPIGMVVDHIDGNGLNNQKFNLRIVSKLTNSRNRHTTIITNIKSPEELEKDRVVFLMRKDGWSEEEIQDYFKESSVLSII
jgi:hypothetical protein